MEDPTRGFAPMMKLMMQGMGALGKAFYDKSGKEALPIITEVARQGGTEWGKIMQQMAPSKDMKAISESFKLMDSMMGMGMETIELSDDVYHFKLSHCPLGLEGTDKGLCEAMMNNEKTMMSTFLGKGVEMEVLKTVAAGDDKCEVVCSIK